MTTKREAEERTEIMWLRLSCDGEYKPTYLDDVVFEARYGGTYEGGAEWVAWLGDLEWLDDAKSGDNPCWEWWDLYEFAPIGRGDTPTAAHEDLFRIQKLGRKAYEIERRKYKLENDL